MVKADFCRIVKAAGRTLLAMLIDVAGLFLYLLRYLGGLITTAWIVVRRNKFKAVSVLAFILLLLNVVQFVSGRAHTKSLEYTNDSLSLSNDNLRNSSLYEEGYRDGLLHMEALTVTVTRPQK